MRTVTIPSNSNPWVCNINGVVYSYEAGTEQSVPDEVASLIDNINADQPVSGHPGNDGDVLTMTESGEPVWATGGGGGEVVTVTIDYDTGTATFDKTYEEILSISNPRFVSNFGVTFNASGVTEEEIDLYSLGFNDVGNSQPSMYIESIIAYPDGAVYYGTGEYSLTSV